MIEGMDNERVNLLRGLSAGLSFRLYHAPGPELQPSNILVTAHGQVIKVAHLGHCPHLGILKKEGLDGHKVEQSWSTWKANSHGVTRLKILEMILVHLLCLPCHNGKE